MRDLYESDLNGNRQSRKLRASEFFSELGAAALKDFDALKTVVVFPGGAVLFHRYR
jgi:hypothetical protein